MRTLPEEREVTVGWYTDSDTCDVYTSDYSYMNKFDKLCEKNPDVWKLKNTMYQDDDVVGKSYETSVKCITFRSEPAKGRELSPEEKIAAAERLRIAREAKKS